MSPLKGALILGALSCLPACDKKDDSAAPATNAPAAAASASHGVDEERRTQEHDEHMDGGREHEHEDRQPK